VEQGRYLWHVSYLICDPSDALISKSFGSRLPASSSSYLRLVVDGPGNSGVGRWEGFSLAGRQLSSPLPHLWI
jgi:hypothetical protein